MEFHEDLHHDDDSDNAAASGSRENGEDKEEDWKTLEKEIFGEGVMLERFRRSGGGGGSDRLDVLRNNSFNKWDALNNTRMNLSYYDVSQVQVFWLVCWLL